MIRYGIVGFGLHAVKRLMPGFERATESRVVALSRRNVEQGRADAGRYAIDYVFGSTDELCRCPEVDAVFVSSPNSLHLSDTLTALRHGKPVLCEKPMAMNAAEATQMVKAAREAKVPLGIAHCFRFEDSVRRIRERVQRGELGKIESISINFTFPGTGSPRVWLHDATLAGGGPIADVGVHTFDAMRHILNDEPESVTAVINTDEHSGGVEAEANFELHFRGGAVGRSFVSFRKEYSTPIEVAGSEAKIRAVDGLTVDRPVTIEFTRGASTLRETVNNSTIYARQVDAFSRAVRGVEPFPIPGEEGLRNQQILDALYRAARSGKEEPV